jgi:hypothetical protein
MIPNQESAFCMVARLFVNWIRNCRLLSSGEN